MSQFDLVASRGALSSTAGRFTRLAPVPRVPIQLRVHRYDGGSGAVTVRGVVTFRRGQMLPSQLATTGRFFVAGQERAVWVEPLTGLHTDGSLRAVRWAFSYTGASAAGEFRFDAPGIARLSSEPGVSGTPWLDWATPPASGFPDDPAHLRACDLVLPQPSEAEHAAKGSAWVTMRNRAAVALDHQVTRMRAEGGPSASINIFYDYYDRALIHWQRFVNTGDPEEYRRGCEFLRYRINHRWEHFALSGLGTNEPDEWFIEGLVSGYWLTGWTASRNIVAEFAQSFRGTAWCGGLGDVANWPINRRPSPYPNSDDYREPRIQARVLHTLLAQWRLGNQPFVPLGAQTNTVPPFASTAELEAYINTVIDLHLGMQGFEGRSGRWDSSQPNGVNGVDQFPASSWQSAQMVFYVGITVDVFEHLFRYFLPLSTARRQAMAASIQSAYSTLFSQDYSAAAKALRYANAPNTQNANNNNHLPALNPFHFAGCAIEFERTGSGLWQTRVNDLVDGLLAGSGLFSSEWNVQESAWQGYNGKELTQALFMSQRAARIL